MDRGEAPSTPDENRDVSDALWAFRETGTGIARAGRMGALSLRDESRSRDEISERFVGQVLGRSSPVVDFRAASRIDSQSDAKTVQLEPKSGASEAGMRSDDGDVEELSDDDVHAESVVRVSQRPTVKVSHPVIANVVRHTRIEFAEIAPSRAARRGVRHAMHLALATAAALLALSAAAIGGRMASRGPVLFPSYLAAATSIKDLRAERHFTEVAGDDVGPDAIAESVDGVLALAATGPTRSAAQHGPRANHATPMAHATTASRASHANHVVHASSSATAAHAPQPHAAHPAPHGSSGTKGTHARTPAHG